MSQFPPGPSGYPGPPQHMPPSHPPYGSYGAYGAGPYGSAPPPKRKHPIAIALVVALCVGMGSCVSWCGYEVYKAQTPEGKRAIAEQERKDEATLAAYIDMLEHVRKNIPAKIDTETRCAAKTTGVLSPPVVDSIYLDTVGRPKEEWEADLAALEKVRNASFSERILLRAATGAVPKAADAGLEFHSATTDAMTLSGYKQIYVIVVDEVIAPMVSGSDWTGGSLVGGLVVYDVATQKPLCQTPISAASSASISYGGGVRIKVRGIPTPTVGDTGLVDAVAKDFKKNVEAAVREGAKRIGAS